VIDKSAIIHPSAEIAKDVNIGPWVVIGANVIIESGTKIYSHVVIGENTIIGKNNKIFPYASVGSDPQHVGFTGEKTRLEIGNENVIREFTTINRGTAEGHGVTKVGNKNYLMAYAHIAHDCVIGDSVVFANTASIAGHVRVGDHAILGAFSGVHQNCLIGAYSFLGRATKIYQDILPFMLVTGNPGTPNAINSVGLRRHGFSRDAIQALKQAFTLIDRRDIKLEQMRVELGKLVANTPEITILLDAINNSKRGFARPSRHSPQDVGTSVM